MINMVVKMWKPIFISNNPNSARCATPGISDNPRGNSLKRRTRVSECRCR